MLNLSSRFSKMAVPCCIKTCYLMESLFKPPVIGCSSEESAVVYSLLGGEKML